MKKRRNSQEKGWKKKRKKNQAKQTELMSAFAHQFPSHVEESR